MSKEVSAFRIVMCGFMFAVFCLIFNLLVRTSSTAPPFKYLQRRAKDIEYYV